jgi:ArsR family transcriptional regulator
MHVMLDSTAELAVRPLSRLFRALSDETRLRIVALLTHGELCVCHIEQALTLTQPNASRQLGVLRAAGLVDTRKEGSWVYYRLVDQDDAVVQSVLDGLTRAFGARRTLRNDVVRLRKKSGPDSCR